MKPNFDLSLDRTRSTPLAEQIRFSMLRPSRPASSHRVRSWRALGAQLGVARGTVRVAYERLIDAQLVVSSGAAGTRVAKRPPKPTSARTHVETDALPQGYRDYSYASGPAIFQMGVPASDCFPSKLFSRISAHAARAEAATPAIYPDPRGVFELRRELAAHLALTRGLKCTPSQIFITSGFAGALAFALRVLRLEGRRAWIEEPSFPLSRRTLEMCQLEPVPIPVGEDGIDVRCGIQRAPDAAAVLVTPGQQAPLGHTLSLMRRLSLLEWASETGAWVIEDDYLCELQLRGRAAPALASLDRTGRVVHLGSFSKTISPRLRLGFMMVRN